MWSIFTHSLAPFLVGILFISISLWMFKYKFKESVGKFISIAFLIVGFLISFTFSFNLNETKQAIKDYRVLLNENEIKNISNITIEPFIEVPEFPFNKTIKNQIVIKNNSDINDIFKELNKIKSINPKAGIAKSVKLKIKLDNNDLIVLSILKTDKLSDLNGYLIELFVNDKVYGKYESDKIWEILFSITKNDFF